MWIGGSFQGDTEELGLAGVRRGGGAPLVPAEGPNMRPWEEEAGTPMCLDNQVNYGWFPQWLGKMPLN